MALQLYGDQIAKPDEAFPTLIRNLVPIGMRGFIFAALAGAVVCAAQPWLYAQLGLSVLGQPETAMAGVVVVATLGVMQVLQGW
jgi:uncharacterized sodium:solute symporter family permease YidK